MLDSVVAIQVDPPLTAENSLTEGDGDAHQVVLAFDRPGPTVLEAGPAPASEQLAENIISVTKAEFPEDVAEIGIPENVLLAEALVEAGVTELVVLSFLLRVGEDRVGFTDLLETLFSLLVARVFVRMMLDCKLAVGLFYLALAGSFVDTEYGIVVFTHHESFQPRLC